jgi:cytoskeletal protein CcmA (bactofilin family)
MRDAEDSSMSIFKQPGATPDRTMSRNDAPVGEAALSVISVGMKVLGDIETSGVVKIEGTIEGAVRGARQLVLGRTGSIKGDVFAEEAILAGTVFGMITATQRVEIQDSSNIQGDIRTKSIVILEGGIINGTVRMDAGAEKVTTATPPQRASLAIST